MAPSRSQPYSETLLVPKPAFCVKSTIESSFYLQQPAPRTSLVNINARVPIPKGLKVFINIAYDPNVPPPPPGDDEIIQRAMLGEYQDVPNPDGWYVPVVVSDARQDKDKAGNSCLVFDAVYNSTLKSRVLRDPSFKIFLIELALQRIEAQSSILLSRQIGAPNILSKGKLEPRSVYIPSQLFPDATAIRPKKSLIQEVEATKETKSILKTKFTSPTLEIPAWSWLNIDAHIQVTIEIPKLTRSQFTSSTLVLEPRRIILDIPPLYTLDVDLSLSDAELVAKAVGSPDATSSDPNSALTLKHTRDLDVDGARAEWRVLEGIIVLIA